MDLYQQIFFTTLALTFGLLHLILFLYNRQLKSNLYFALFAFLFLFSSYDLFLDLGIMRSIYDINNGYPFGFTGLIVSMSVYLASDFARTNEKMLRKERQTKELEVQRRLLEAEDERKSRELEEARKLQYSMLPKCVDEINGLDICLDMKAATEVGGDYYDYNISEDGTLTIAIGDATGHGMRAGIMVSIIKSRFITHASETEIPLFFEKCSRTIKQMQLGNLFMTLRSLFLKPDTYSYTDIVKLIFLGIFDITRDLNDR
jgi:hypothetical protein